MLKKIGAVDEAQAMIDEIIAIIEPQMAGGVVIGENSDLRVMLAALRASNSEADSALAALQLDNRQQGLRCTPCLRNWSQFDDLRGDPRFEAIVSKQEAENEMYRQRLADEGMLLTPEELLALEDFGYDPFAD